MAGFPSVFFLFFFLIGAAILVAALVSVGKGVRKARRSARLDATGIEAVGTVVDSQMHSRRSGGSDHQYTRITFSPVVTYRTRTGQEITAVGPAESGSSFVKGSQVPLRYNPDNPTQIELTSGQGRGSGAVGLIIGGIVVAIVAAIILMVGASMAGSFGG